MITAGAFVKLEKLESNFGIVKVLDTGRKLRNHGLFDKGWATIDSQMQAIFLFALFATNTAKHAIKAVKRSGAIYSTENLIEYPNRGIIAFITELIDNPDLRKKIDFILVSRKTGWTEVHFKSGKKSLFSDGKAIDYDKEEVNPTESDNVTKINMHFFEVLNQEITHKSTK